MDKKIEILKNLNTDNSRFILKVIKAYENYKKEIEKKKSNIITNLNNTIENDNIINLDKIWSKPYFYTRMRLKFNEIVKQFNNISFDEFAKNPKKICNDIVKIEVKKDYIKPEDNIDIVTYIKNLDERCIDNKPTFYAKEIDEETMFKEEQITKAIEILRIKNRREQISFIYDEIYNFLDRDFLSYEYCDFTNNKCVAQRHITLFPVTSKNGCCFMQVRKCNHLKDGGVCEIKCVACRLFSCPYLSKKGVGYRANEFVLLKAFLSKKQRKHLIFDFYKDKEIILNNIISCSK